MAENFNILCIVNDEYYTLAKIATDVIKIKGSRFIGYASPVREREDAEAYIDRIRKKHHDATHNCSAYRIGLADGAVLRFNDDGEPSGTAGMPILEAIDGRELTDTVCVVTRYFGGIKLGTGGLARAYGECAGRVLDKARSVRRFMTDTIRVALDYDLTGIVMHAISTFEARVLDTQYGERTEMCVSVRRSRKDAFLKAILDRTSGKAVVLTKEGNR